MNKSFIVVGIHYTSVCTIKENQILINGKIMTGNTSTRLVITEYHCIYIPCSFNKLFKF